MIIAFYTDKNLPSDDETEVKKRGAEDDVT